MKKSELVKKNQKLVEIKAQLKSNLFGIDAVIDQVVDSIASWYFFPENQTRPLIINLWGMTGVGKSDLVWQLVNLLDFETDYFQFDMGELGHDSSTDIRGIFSDSVQIKGVTPRIILLDEFQHCRSINESRHEIKQKEMRLIWQLMDTGKVNYIDTSIYSRRKINSMISKMDYWVTEGMTVHEGMIPSDYFGYFEKDEDDNELGSYSNESSEFAFDKKQLKTLWEINRKRFPQLQELRKHIQELDTIGVQEFLSSSLAMTTKPIEMDFTQSLIFVVGNLDEAYEVSKDQSPDLSPDLFHEITAKIKMPDIKQALLTRFRSEQIARLGNNHIIYPSLDQKAFTKIIENELATIASHFIEKIGLEITFGNSVKDWIFQEGVIATQGVRPLKSSIKYGLEDLLPQIALHFYECEQEIDRVHLRFRSKLVACYLSQEKLVFEKKFVINEKQSCLKENRKDDQQALVAVHESGHALAYMAFFHKYPEQVKSVTAGSGVGGFMAPQPITLLNFGIVKKKTYVYLAGYLAEKEVFGFDQITGGSSSDISKVTGMCMTFFKECGFSGSLIRTAETEGDYSSHLHDMKSAEQKAVDFIENSQREVEALIKREKKLLIQMARKLADQTTLDQESLSELVDKFGTEYLKKELETKSISYRDRLFSIEFSIG